LGVSHKRKLCFVHIPKTGGVSIARALELTELAHQPASYYRDKYPDYTIFTVMRPYMERVASAKEYYKNDPDRANYNMATYETDHWLDAPCDFYLNFNNLRHEFKHLMDCLCIGGIELPHLNTLTDPVDKNRHHK